MHVIEKEDVGTDRQKLTNKIHDKTTHSTSKSQFTSQKKNITVCDYIKQTIR